MDHPRDQLHDALHHLARAASQPLDDPALPRLQAAILRLLEARRGATLLAVARELGRARQTVARAADALERAGLLLSKRQAGARGRYLVPAKESRCAFTVDPADRGPLTRHAMSTLYLLRSRARMCLTCAYFAPSPPCGQHVCARFRLALADADLRFHCNSHWPSEDAAEKWRRFSR